MPQPRSVCAEYSHSRLVVMATLVKIDPVDYSKQLRTAVAYYYTLKTDHTYRGTPEKTIRIYEENSSGRAPFEWKLGTKYILFLFDSSEKSEKGLLELDGCGNSRPILSNGSFVLKQIASVKNRQTAQISGMVGGIGGVGPWPNVQVLADGDEKTYKGVTDEDGGFSIEVPPGHYTVRPVDPRLSFDAYELSYENPNDLKMGTGSCAQVQFVGRSRP